MNMMNNQMYNNNGMYNNGMRFTPGTVYNPMPKAKMTQPLTREEINALRRNNNNGFSMQLTKDQIIRAKCTHKENGQIVLIENQDGTETCPICGTTFVLSGRTPEEVRQIVQETLDILQSIKTYYIDMPDGVANEFFNIIPLIEKIPGLYQIALDDFNKHDETQIGRNGMENGFNMFNNLTQGGCFGYQPQMNYPQPQAYGYPNQGMNVNGYYQPQMGYTPQQAMMQPNVQQCNGYINNDPFYNNEVQQPQQNQQPQQDNKQNQKMIHQTKQFDV